MLRRWIMGGIWGILFVCGENATAQKNTAPGNSVLCDVCISGNREMPNKVKKITFQGTKHIKEDELRKIVGINPDTSLNPCLNLLGCQKIMDKYEEIGRPFTTCTLLKGSNLSDTEVVYQITEGPKVTVRGDEKAACAEAKNSKCESFSKEASQVVHPISKKENSHGCNGLMKAVAIPFHIRKIRVLGNKQTSTESILAHVPLAPGQTVYWPEIQAAEKMLSELDLFVVDAAMGIRPVITTEYREDGSGQSDLIIHVMEKPIGKCNCIKPPQ